MPKFSVIIPAHNAQKYIEECLLSLKRQTFKDFEVIVVDDGSTDNTYTIASKYAIVIKTPFNLGAGAARNLGAKASGGQILCFTDADVVLPEDWLEKIFARIQNKDVKCIAGGYRNSIGNSFIERFAHLELVYRRKNLPLFVATAVANNFSCYRDIFFEFGGFPEQYKCDKCEDLRLSFRISSKYPILWDQNNGVDHHFRVDLIAYLKQQFYFGRDTAWSYYQFPGLFGKQTHQGKRIYIETVFMFLALISFFLSFIFPILFVATIFVINYRLLMFLKKEDLPILNSFLVIILRDFVCVFSFFAGAYLCLKDFIKNLLTKKTSLRVYFLV